MLATLVIGLREGLEAALIVGMIAAFLRRNGISLRPMWLGVGAAALLSALTGIALELVSAALPQQQQEAMETVIGVAAVVIVTFMVLWMSKNSRSMQSTLESHAGSALKAGSVAALAGMAFLAVLREGVETAVFMVAAFQSSLSPLAAGAGAVLGLTIACGIGFLLFRGAIKLNLAKFFKATGVFLVFVAAGLVMKSLRTAHEAGWLNTGQGTTVNLSWLAPNGSARAAILTGVLGIPNDPRVVELLGWVLYLVPMLAFILWPRAKKPAAANVPRLQFAAAGTLAAAAVALAVAAPLAIPASSFASGTTPAVTSPEATALTLRLAPVGGAAVGGAAAASSASRTLLVTTSDGSESRIPLTSQGTESHAGRTVSVYTATGPDGAQPSGNPAGGTPAGGTDEPAQLSAAQLLSLNGGRMPVGISASTNPGPFSTVWQHRGEVTVWLSGTQLIDAVSTADTALTLSGGGLSSPRTIALANDGGWHVTPEHVSAAVNELNTIEAARSDNVLWSRMLPFALLLAALGLLTAGHRNRRQLLATAPFP